MTLRQRHAVFAACGLLVTMFLPSYSLQSVDRRTMRATRLRVRTKSVCGSTFCEVVIVVGCYQIGHRTTKVGKEAITDFPTAHDAPGDDRQI